MLIDTVSDFLLTRRGWLLGKEQKARCILLDSFECELQALVLASRVDAEVSLERLGVKLLGQIIVTIFRHLKRLSEYHLASF